MTKRNAGAFAGQPIYRNQLLCRFFAIAICMLGIAGHEARAAQVALTWQDNSNNEFGFKVERATGAGAYLQIATTAANGVKHIDTTAAGATTYKYRVFAYNAAGRSVASNIATVTTPRSPSNPAPSNLSPTITEIPNHSGYSGSSIGPFAFVIADDASATAGLTVFASSSNTALVPTSGLLLAGSGANRTITITPATGRTGTATITVSVSNGTGETTTTFTVQIDPTSPATGRLVNHSTRVVCRPGREASISGFVINGTTNKRMLLRAVGPTLGTAPFHVAGALPDPRVVLKRWNGSAFVDVASNDNWNSGPNSSEIRKVSASLFAFPIPEDSRDAALLLNLAPGQYTAVADDASGGGGVVILETYDTDASTHGSSFVNMSNRGYVGTGDEVMISGFVVSDHGPKTLLVRAVGPALAEAPFHMPNTIRDPLIEIYRRNHDGTDSLVSTHDNWGEDGDAAIIAQISGQVAAFPLPNGSKDAAFVATFAPGVYTAVVRGVDGVTGSALVEIYTIE